MKMRCEDAGRGTMEFGILPTAKTYVDSLRGSTCVQPCPLRSIPVADHDVHPTTLYGVVVVALHLVIVLDCVPPHCG